MISKEVFVKQTSHEGTTSLRDLRLELLTPKFEYLRMMEDETIDEFNARICNIANDSFSLGTQNPEERLVKKALQSLPPRFAHKVLAIKEVKDLKVMKLGELIGSSRTFEIELEEDEKKQKKTLGLQSGVAPEEVAEDLAESMAQLAIILGGTMRN